MKKSLLLVLLLFLVAPASAQPLASYTNLQNELMVWNRGMIHKMDYMPPTYIQVGRTTIPYLDNSRTFKIYYNGSVQQVNAGFTNNFFVTDNLVAFVNQKSLSVFDKGTIKHLTGIADQYFVQDSLIFYLDGLKNDYKVYYNGQIQQIEAYFADSQLSTISVSDNIIAYNNFANQFRIFFQGRKLAVEEFPVNAFKAGRNTVAYIDGDKKFKIFHSGKVREVDNFPPQSYQVGDDLVAYVTTDGFFKIFYKDSIYSVGFGNPPYQVGDNIVAFKDATGYLRVFYKGDITDMENYYPAELSIQYNSLAYVNQAGILRLFTEGETYEVTNSELTSWNLNYDVITYQIGQGMFKVFYKGQEF